MTEKEQYEEDRLRIVVNKFEFLFQTVIRNRIFDDSISNYMRFLTHFLPSTDPNNPHLIRRTPLLVLQLNVNPIKKKKENRRGSKKKEQAANEEEAEENIFYEPNIEAIEYVLTLPFEILQKFSEAFMKMDKDLLPLLNLESTPAFYVKK